MKMEYEKITDAGQFRKQELTGFSALFAVEQGMRMELYRWYLEPTAIE